jgi:hypothetical protein
MALLFVDSFDHYATENIESKYVDSYQMTIISGGRRATNCMRASNHTGYVRVVPPVATQTLIIGFAVKIATLYNSNDQICAFNDNASANPQVKVMVTPSGGISVYRYAGAGDVLLCSTPNSLIHSNTWHYVEVKVKISTTVGEVVVQIDGDEVANVSSVNTQSTANAWTDYIEVSPGNVSSVGDVDDLYLCDISGAAPHNSFLGDVRIDLLLPNGEGSNSDFTPSTGSTHYTLVDETVPNITDYNSSATNGHQDSYNYQDLLTLTGSIFGAQLVMYAWKDDAGQKGVKPLCRSSTTEDALAAQALSTDVKYYRGIWVKDPSTATAWIEAGVNAAQWGAEVSAI